jgi:hypothetical protein
MNLRFWLSVIQGELKKLRGDLNHRGLGIEYAFRQVELALQSLIAAIQ